MTLHNPSTAGRLEQAIVKHKSGRLQKTLVVFLIWMSGAVGASASDFDTVVAQIRTGLPAEWEIVETAANDVPIWSLRGESCLKLVLAGPAKSGYRYYDAEGRFIQEHYGQREAIIVWIAESDFDMGWSSWFRVRNRFAKVPIGRPATISEGPIRVYAHEGSFAADLTYSIVSPPGTALARSIPPTRTWPHWKQDLRATLRED